MLNTCVLAGNLGNDPEVHFNSEGEPIASFNLAFRAGKKKTGWIKVTCFNTALGDLREAPAQGGQNRCFRRSRSSPVGDQ